MDKFITFLQTKLLTLSLHYHYFQQQQILHYILHEYFYHLVIVNIITGKCAFFCAMIIIDNKSNI